jgi:hypothetical protein
MPRQPVYQAVSGSRREPALYRVPVSFFEPPPEPDPEPEEESDSWTGLEPRGPVWGGPSRYVLGQAVPMTTVLVKTEEVAIAVVGVTAFPNGMMFTMRAYRRHRGRSRRDRALFQFGPDPFGYGASPLRYPGQRGELPDEVFRFGVLLSDGGKATNLDEAWRDWGAEDAPDGPLLLQRGGGGSDDTWSQGYWLWPLPPPGDLTFVCEWPAMQIPESRTTIDTAAIRAAAAHAITLWADEDGA